MKTLFQITLVLLAFHFQAMSQSISWSSMSAGPSFPRTITYGGSQTATIYYSSSPTVPSTAPNDMILFQSGTNQTDIWGCSGNAQVNSFAGSTPGLVISNNFTSVTEADAGNYIHISFSEPICGVNFNLIDLTSLALSDNYPTSGTQGVYNDKVTITATDVDGNPLSPTLTKVGEGYSSNWTTSCATAKIWNQNAAMPTPPTPAASERTITGNTAYIVAGSYSNSSTPAAATCASGGFVNSMDINVSITECVKTIIIHYYNHPTFLGLRNNGGTCNTPVLDANASAQQTILIGNFNYVSLLPIKFSNFTGLKKENKIKLNWKTTGEVNTQGFDILHSKNGLNFSKVGFVPSLGNSTSANYDFEHQNPVKGKNYYKLLQKDIDGNQTFSKVIQVNDSKYNISVTQNNVAKLIYINGLTQFNSQTKIVLRDMQGKLIYKGVNQSSIDVSSVSSGVYIIQVLENETMIYNDKVVIKN